MKIKDILKKRDRGFGLEFFPPKREDEKESFLKTASLLSALGPLYASVTYGAGGSTQDRTVRTLGWLRGSARMPLMSHLTAIGATRGSLGDLMDELDTLGVDNILALRGDPPRIVPDLDPLKGEFPFARDLVAFLRETGQFSIGVAVYPEGHGQSPSLEKDIEYTKRKIDAGADFAITQMFFENDHFYRFLDRAGRAGISIPIIPGIMPIVDCRRIKEFANLCSATIPQAVLDRIEPVADLPEEMRKRGVEHAVKQVEDLLAHGVRYIHFYTMNRPESVLDILSAAPGLVPCSPAAA